MPAPGCNNSVKVEEDVIEWIFFLIALIRDLYEKQPPSHRNAGSICKLPVD